MEKYQLKYLFYNNKALYKAILINKNKNIDVNKLNKYIRIKTSQSILK